MKKLIILTALFTLFLSANAIHAQKRSKLELYEVKVPTILKLGGDEVGFKVVIKNTGEAFSSADNDELNVKVYVNGSLVSSDGDGLRFWCPQLDPGETFEKEYSVHVREKFRGERIKIEVNGNKMGTLSKDIDLEK